MRFHIDITIFSIIWVALAFIQKFKLGLYCLTYVALVCGAVFLYNGIHIAIGYACIGVGSIALLWLIVLTRKQYDKYKYKDKKNKED